MTDATRHALVVTALTAGFDAVRDVLRARLARGPAEFTLLLPAVEGSEAAARHLLATVERLRADGFDVVGQLGDPDPELALAQVWDPVEYDEVLHVAADPAG